jgi:hypothetical protein
MALLPGVKYYAGTLGKAEYPYSRYLRADGEARQVGKYRDTVVGTC